MSTRPVIVLLCLALWQATGGCGADPTAIAVISEARARLDAAAVSSQHRAVDGSSAGVIANALGRVHASTPVLPEEPSQWIRSALIDAAQRGDTEAADRLVSDWSTLLDAEPDAAAPLVDALLDAGILPTARRWAWELAVSDPGGRTQWMHRWYRSFADDDGFVPPEPLTVTAGGDVDALRPLGRGTSVLFRMDRDGETRWVFKPHQTVRVTNIRGELASWRLCQLIRCAIEIPRNIEMRVDEESMLELTDLDDPDDLNDRFGTRLSDIVWIRDEQGTPWVWGTRKDWVPGFAQFPVEVTDAWAPWLEAGISRDALRALPFNEMIEEVRRVEPRRWERLVEEGTGQTADDFARQLSDMHVLDVLANNWDRYRADFRGANCQYRDGRIVSIDNGATFPVNEDDVAFRSARRSIREVQLFSREVIDAIRWMEPAAVYPILFPPSPLADRDEERFAYFLVRREWLLAYVDELIAEHGEEAVVIWP